MRLLACGGRHYTCYSRVVEVLDQHLAAGPVELICGMARGADTLAFQWAISRNVPVHKFPADWVGDGPRAAGPLRNRRMLAEGRPDLVVAFPGGKGTADMVNIAREAGVEVRHV